MLITPPRWLQSDSSIHPARRRSCDWRLKVRANQEASFAAVGRYFDFSAAQVTGVDVAAGYLQLRLCESLCPSLPAGHLCPVGFAWVDPQTVVTYRVW
ncbi:hypothetical protein [Xanthomonas axonopodis]